MSASSLYHRLLGTPEPTQVVAQYVWGARPGHRDELVHRDRDSDGSGTLDERLYCLMDYFNPVAVVDAAGEVVERYAWSAFGLRSILAPNWSERDESDFDWNFGFHGQFLDTETGYNDYGFRYYTPWLGRWITRDPIGEKGGLNLNAAASNDFVNNNDYLGLQNAGEPTVGYTTQTRPENVVSASGEPPTCGNGRWEIVWALSAETSNGGYIVQHIEIQSYVEDCQGNDVTNERHAYLTYTEAWSVNKGLTGPAHTRIVDDTFYYAGGGNCTRGSFQISGIAEFIPVTNLPPQLKMDNVKEAGRLLAVEPAMAIPGGTGQINREFLITWDCCRESDSLSKFSYEPVNT